MNRTLGLLMSGLVMSIFAAGCQTTQTEQLTLAERRESAIETVMADEEGQEKSVSDADYDPNEMICKTVKSTGTRLGKSKDCRTAKEWKDSMSAATRAMTDTQNSKGGLGSKME